MRRAFLTLVLVLCAPAAAHADTTITFDDLAPGTTLTNQYAAQQVIFAPATDWGFTGQNLCTGNSAIAEVGTRAWSGSRVAKADYCPQNELTHRGSLFGVLPTFRTFVRMRVGVTQDSATPPLVRLRAYDYKRQLIGETSVTPAAGKVGTLIQVSAVAPTIAFFALSWADVYQQHVAIDDLTYDSFPTPPDPQIAIGRADGALAFRARMGGTVAASVKLLRFNGSTGPVSFSAGGLPGVISSSVFTPNPANGTAFESTVNLALTTDATATEGRVNAEITANPSGTAGSTMQTLALPIDIVPPFRVTFEGQDLDAAGTVNLAPCVRRDVTVDLAVEPGFLEPIALSVTTGSGVLAALSSAQVLPGFGTRSELSLTNPGGMSAASQAVVVQGTSATATRAGTVTVNRKAGVITSVTTRAGTAVFTPSGLLAPLLQRSGTTVTIRGEGFCPGSLVQFGGGGPDQAPRSVDPDGRSIVADVPYDATPGSITVKAPGVGGNPPTAIAQSAFFPLDSYRNTRAYPFPNFKSSDLAFDDVVDLYGYTETHIEIDPCDDLTFGLVNCSLGATFIPKPSALLYLNSVDDSGSGGNCFGMAISSWRLSTGQHALSDFIPSNARTVFELNGPAGPSDGLRHYIRLQHMVQSSRQGIQARATRGFETTGQLGDRVKAIIAQGRPALMDLWNGDSGHTVLAYRITDVPGGLDIDVYDSNYPYLSTDAGNQAQHASNMTNSRIMVRNRQWSYAGLSGWTNRPFADIHAMDPKDLPERPLLPDRLVDVIATMSSGDDPKLSNLRDAAGKPVRPIVIPVSTGLARAGTITVVPAKGGLSATVKGGGTVALMGAGGRALLVQGARDLVVGRGARTLDASGAGAVHLVATQQMRGGERVVDATFRGAAGRVGIGLAGESLTVRALRGGTVELRFGAVGRQGIGDLVVPAFRLGAGETATVSASSWTLPGTVTVRGAGRTLQLTSRLAPASVKLRSLKATLARSGRVATAVLKAKVRGRAEAVSASLTWRAAGKRGVVKLTTAQAEAAARGREVRVRLGRIPAGRVKLALTLASTTSYLPRLTSAQATAR